MISKRKSCAGTTLAELLVVMATFLILVTVLIPAFRISHETAASAECLSNLKQIGSGVMAYSQDYDGCLPSAIAPGQPPLPYGTDANGDPGGWSWQGTVSVPQYFGSYHTPPEGYDPNIHTKPAGWAWALKDHIKNRSVFVCPSDTTPIEGDFTGSNQGMWIPGRFHVGSYQARYVTSVFMPQQVGSVRSSMAKRPSRLVYVYEQNNWHRNFGYPAIGYPRHPMWDDRGADIGTQYCNALFMDGHVASWPVPANSYTNQGYAGYQRYWFYGDVYADKGTNYGNMGRTSLVDYSYTGEMVRCDPYDTVR